MLSGLQKRWRCPETVQGAVEDFIDHQNPQSVLDFLSNLSESERDSDATLSHRRRIAYIYGLASSLGDPSKNIWAPGFNTKLLEACGDADPYRAAQQILGAVYESLRKKD